MTEQVSYLERYQGMNPHELNREMKGLFTLLPDFDSTIQDLSLLTKEQLNERIRAHQNYRLRNKFIGQLKDLLSFTKITESFKSYS